MKAFLGARSEPESGAPKNENRLRPPQGRPAAKFGAIRQRFLPPPVEDPLGLVTVTDRLLVLPAASRAVRLIV